MEVNTNNPVSNKVQGLETTPRIDDVKREKEETSCQQTAETGEGPDYRVSLSEMSKQAVAELAAPAPTKEAGEGDLSEDEAARLSQQASTQLAQTNVAIANQAMQKAVDLFT